MAIKGMWCITAVVLSLHVASVCHTFWSHELAVQAQIVSQLMASKVAVLAALNLWFCVLVSTWQIIKWLVFGSLRAEESKAAVECLVEYGVFKFVFTGMVPETNFLEIVVWNAVFCGSGLLSVLSAVAGHRLEHVLQQGQDTRSSVQKNFLLFSFVLASVSFLWTMLLVATFQETGHSTLAFLLISPLVSLVSASQLLFKQFVYNWPDAKPLISQSEFAKDLVVLGAAVLNDIHIWTHSGIFLSFFDIVLFMHVRKVVSRLVARVHQHRASCLLRLVAEARFPCATAEQIKAYDNSTCAICMDKVSSGRLVPCGHVFHLDCLVSWLEYHYSCPKCRRSLEEAGSEPSEAEGEAEGEAEVEGDLPIDRNLELVDESTEEQLAQTAVTTEGASPELDERSAAALLSQAQNTTVAAAAGESAEDSDATAPDDSAALFSLTSWLPSFSFSSGPATLAIEPMVSQLHDLFPQMSRIELERELRQSGSIELAAERILSASM